MFIHKLIFVQRRGQSRERERIPKTTEVNVHHITFERLQPHENDQLVIETCAEEETYFGV